MQKTIKFINLIKTRDLPKSHFLSKLNSQYSDIMYYTDVQWLSKGKFLKRYFSLCEEIKLFIHKQKSEFPEIKTL